MTTWSTVIWFWLIQALCKIPCNSTLTVINTFGLHRCMGCDQCDYRRYRLEYIFLWSNEWLQRIFSCVTENINDVENIMFRHIARIVVSSQKLNPGDSKQRNTDTRFTYYIHFSIYSRFYISLYLYMVTSSNGNIFRVTGHLCGEFTGPGEFPTQRPVTRSFDVLFDLRLNKRLNKQSWGWWFETLSRPLWRQCNEMWSLRTVLTSVPHGRTGYLNKRDIFSRFWLLITNACLFSLRTDFNYSVFQNGKHVNIFLVFP